MVRTKVTLKCEARTIGCDASFLSLGEILGAFFLAKTAVSEKNESTRTIPSKPHVLFAMR